MFRLSSTVIFINFLNFHLLLFLSFVQTFINCYFYQFFKLSSTVIFIICLNFHLMLLPWIDLLISNTPPSLLPPDTLSCIDNTSQSITLHYTPPPFFSLLPYTFATPSPPPHTHTHTKKKFTNSFISLSPLIDRYQMALYTL